MRERLLASASRVLLRGGVMAFTLDAVASEAGTSKGALLHHFPNKDKLRDSMLDDVIDRVRKDLVDLVRTDLDPIGRHLRAYVVTLVAPAEASALPSVLATLLFDRGARERWQAFSEEWLKPDLEGVEPRRAEAVRALADGSWLAVAIGLYPTATAERAETLQRLIRLALA